MLMLGDKVEVKKSVFSRSFRVSTEKDIFKTTLRFQAVMILKTSEIPRCNCL